MRRVGAPAWVWRWLGIGLLVRFLVMPFAVSGDFLAVWWRAHLIAYDGQVFADYLVNMGAHHLHALSLLVLDPLLPPESALWTDPWWWGDAEALGPQVLRAFVDAPGAFRTLFVLKLPYLAADLAAGAGLLALTRSRRAWIFWMLSPVGIYASYLFSRYEAFPVALVVLAVLLVERDRPWSAALALGAAVTMRSYPILLLPVVALVAVRGVPRQALWTAAALTPLALVMGANLALGGSVGEFARLGDFATGENLFAFTLDAGGSVLYLFFLALFALYGLVAGRSLGWWGPGPVARRDLWVWLLAAHALLFGLAGFSPHYFMWMTPFVALALARRPAWRGILWLHLAQAVVAFVIADTGGWGIATLAPLFGDLPAPAGPVITPALADRWEPLLHTVFTALTLLFALPALAELLPRRADLTPEPAVA